VNKLVLFGTPHATLQNEVDMLAVDPLLLPVPKSIGLHGNEVKAFTCWEVTNSDLVQFLLCN
jgi:hypothetical protein